MRQRGFTIIELLIATLIFAIMVIVITTAVLSFSHQYYRGVTQSSTQSTARSIIDDVTRSIQFNPGQVHDLHDGSGNLRGYCIGDAKRYSFQLNQQVDSSSPDTAQHQSYHALVSDTRPSCTTATTPLDVTTLSAKLTTTNARELLGEHMRLAKLSIEDDGSGFYTVRVKVVYGDDDLLTSPTDPNMTCKATKVSQFCATSELSTTVKKRVN